MTEAFKPTPATYFLHGSITNGSPKQGHQLGTKCPDAQTVREISHATYCTDLISFGLSVSCEGLLLASTSSEVKDVIRIHWKPVAEFSLLYTLLMWSLPIIR